MNSSLPSISAVVRQRVRLVETLNVHDCVQGRQFLGGNVSARDVLYEDDSDGTHMLHDGVRTILERNTGEREIAGTETTAIVELKLAMSTRPVESNQATYDCDLTLDLVDLLSHCFQRFHEHLDPGRNVLSSYRVGGVSLYLSFQ